MPPPWPAAGWKAGGRARGANLEKLWRRVSSLGDFSPGAASPALDMMTRMFSPYQLNPLGLNPLRAVLEEVIDFEALQLAERPRLFVSATELKQGRAVVFENPEMTVEALLASACLPHLYRAVTIGGAHYWDGGFMANPTIFPLVFQCDSRDVMIVQIDSLTTDEVPRSVRQINNRRSQIMFNAPLMRELEALSYMGHMAGQKDGAPPRRPSGQGRRPEPAPARRRRGHAGLGRFQQAARRLGLFQGTEDDRPGGGGGLAEAPPP